MVLEYKYEKFGGYVDNAKARKRMEKKAIQKYRSNTGQYAVEKDEVEKVTVNYLRHHQTEYEKYLTLTETPEEYTHLKVLVLANIGKIFPHLASEACSQIYETVRDYNNQKYVTNPKYNWWYIFKKLLGHLFARRKILPGVRGK